MAAPSAETDRASDQLVQSWGCLSEETSLLRATNAMLFDPSTREAGPTVYDRADPVALSGLLGGAVTATEIRVDNVVRWVVYSKADTLNRECDVGVAMRIIPAREDRVFAGRTLLAGRRGPNDRDIDLDLLWPCFEFRWLRAGDSSEAFRLGRNYKDRPLTALEGRIRRN